MSLFDKTARERSTILLMLFTLVGIVPELILALPILTGAADTIRLGSIPIPALDPLLFVLYPSIPIIYSATLSHLFKPKRIVSPLNIQLGTTAVISMIIAGFILTQPPTSLTPHQLSGNFAVSWIFWSLILLVLGFFQTLVVLMVVGLNTEHLPTLSYSINERFATVAEFFDEDFLYTTELHVRTRQKEFLMLEGRYSRGERIILALGRERLDALKSTLATVAYDRRFYELMASRKAIVKRDSIIRDIKGRLSEKNASVRLEVCEPDDYVSKKAHDHALIPTRSKISIGLAVVKSVPRYYLYAIILTFLAFGVVSLAFITGSLQIDIGTYITIVIVFILALLTELGLPLREELAHRRSSEII